MIKKGNKFLIYDVPRHITAKHLLGYGVYFIISQLYALYFFVFKIKETKKKYDVSICAIFKNEAVYLQEWLEYHILVGVDHFYMYNNNSNDAYAEVLDVYIKRGIVTLVDWPQNQAQLEAYEHCVENYANETKWLGFIDIDEFVVPKHSMLIYDILQKYNKTAGSVMLYWKVFGSSGKVDRDLSRLVTEDFTVAWEKYCDIGKCFYNTDFSFDRSIKYNGAFHHILWTRLGKLIVPPRNIWGHFCVGSCNDIMKSKDIPMQINHYLNKSLKEYDSKITKGDVFFTSNPHTLEYFLNPESNCTTTDYSIYKYLIELKIRLAHGNEAL